MPIEFEECFPDEEAAYRYLERLRWPEGFRCPRCAETTTAWRSGRGLLIPACRRQVSVTAGTLFEKTRKPLRSWLHVAWEITNAKQGVNALTLQHRLGLRSYQTAWSWLHKFRRAMVRPDRDRLAGAVEVDEAYVGGEEPGVRGRQTKTKSIVVMAVELRGDRRTGRIRLRHVPDVSGESLVGFVTDVVAPGSVVKTDGWPGYSRLTKHNYAHQVTVISSSGDPAVVVMPSVHFVAALLKRWLLGTFHGGLAESTSATTWTSSPFATIAGPRGPGACCSTGFLNRAFGPATLRRLSSFLAPAVVRGARRQITHPGTTTCRGWLS